MTKNENAIKAFNTRKDIFDSLCLESMLDGTLTDAMKGVLEHDLQAMSSLLQGIKTVEDMKYEDEYE